MRKATSESESPLGADSTLPVHGLGKTEFVVLSSLISATIAISIDTILPAFDEMSETFGLADGSASLSITMFLGALGLGMLIWGPLADAYGRKPVLWVSLGLFILGAGVSSLAGSFTVFLAGRVLWGLAAAGPRVIGLAIVRDCYAGDEMARIMSLISAVFLIVPIMAPALGEVILTLTSWRWTTGVAVLIGLVAALWLNRMNETLNPDLRQPVHVRRIIGNTRTVMTNRVTVAYTLGTTFAYAAFFPWLGSSPRIINDIYNRPGQFAALFAVNAALMAAAIIMAERLVKRQTAYWVVWRAAALATVASVGYVAVSVLFGGRPDFFVWFAMASTLTLLNAAFSPITTTLAMEPMGSIAGIASSVTGAIVFIASALLSGLTDQFIDDSVTPFGVGFLVYSLAALIAIQMAGAPKRAASLG